VYVLSFQTQILNSICWPTHNSVFQRYYRLVGWTCICQPQYNSNMGYQTSLSSLPRHATLLSRYELLLTRRRRHPKNSSSRTSKTVRTGVTGEPQVWRWQMIGTLIQYGLLGLGLHRDVEIWGVSEKRYCSSWSPRRRIPYHRLRSRSLLSRLLQDCDGQYLDLCEVSYQTCFLSMRFSASSIRSLPLARARYHCVSHKTYHSAWDIGVP
jgi:hypothetical protein